MILEEGYWKKGVFIVLVLVLLLVLVLSAVCGVSRERER
jgi:hypothetical protein